MSAPILALRGVNKSFGPIDVLHEIGQIEGRRIKRNIARFHARKVEHIVEQIQQPRAGLADGAGIIALSRRQIAFL